jgi:transcriptional regulator with XRE-family HTH domain
MRDPVSLPAAGDASSVDYAELGDRLRAYRIGVSMTALDAAKRLGISRAALYRLEQGQIVKIETLERLARLLNVSLASLLGVEVEYYSSARGFLERMRQIELEAERIVAHFEPISQLLASHDYHEHLREMLLESIPKSVRDLSCRHEEVAGIIDILGERKEAFAARRPHIVSLLGLRELEQFLRTGLVGAFGIDDEAILRQRLAAARGEVERIAEMMECEPMNVQIGLIEDAMPATSFQLFYGARRTVLAVSPFRLGAMPSIRNGVATITAAPEPVRLYEEMAQRLWENALKGKTGAARLRTLLARSGGGDKS